MSSGRLTQYMEAGFPYLKHMTNLPDGLLPDFAKGVCQLGDEGVLRLAETLGLCDRLKPFLAQAPEPGSLPVEIWREGIAGWSPVYQVLSVTMALLRACEKVEALERRGVLLANVASIVRALAIIAYAAFDPNGVKILARLAGILGGNPAQPAVLLDRYVKALEARDYDTLTRIEECILLNPAWAEWSARVLVTGKEFPFLPRVIGISPPLTRGLKQALVNMMLEAPNVEHSRNYPS